MNGTDCLLAFAALDETRVAAAQDAERASTAASSMAVIFFRLIFSPPCR